MDDDTGNRFDPRERIAVLVGVLVTTAAIVTDIVPLPDAVSWVLSCVAALMAVGLIVEALGVARRGSVRRLPAGPYDVVLDAVGERRIHVVKVVRECDPHRSAKELAVIATPYVVASAVSDGAARRLVADLHRHGAVAHLRGRS